MEAQVHKFVHATGSNDYRDIIWCEYCGYIAYYANDTPERREQRQRELPSSCIPKPSEKP